MASVQIGRDLILTVGTTRIAINPEGTPNTDAEGNVTSTPSTMTPLHVSFRIDKTLTSEPNKAEITIYNLTKDLRSSFNKKGSKITIEAGYADDRTEIFQGDIESSTTSRDGSDWVTKIQGGDGSTKLRTSKINESLKPGATIKDALKAVVKCMGLDDGNATEKIDEGGFREGITEFIKGVTLSGKCSDVMDKLTKSAGLEWSVQGGKNQLTLRGKGQTVRKDAVLVNQSTGMIGSPEVGEKGIVTVKTLLNGRIWPGRKIKVESLLVDGFFKVGSVSHEGSTFGDSWYTSAEAEPL